ncbi:MAG: hypothetical protein UY96_C0034G0015 [Parcubacteria group bacterium GW2011_GWB1_56_8]|nr:MAG: hypothetical protein UY96_C0034G0015 [Parcubacteria group bacterium GW2011_GWB1_56_8]
MKNSEKRKANSEKNIFPFSPSVLRQAQDVVSSSNYAIRNPQFVYG